MIPADVAGPLRALLGAGAVLLPVTTGKAVKVRRWPALTAEEADRLPQWRTAVAVALRLDGRTVIDIDAPDRTDEVLAALGVAGAPTMTALTPSGGSHHHYLGERRSAARSWGEVKSGRGHVVLVARLDGRPGYTFDGRPAVEVPASYRFPPSEGPAPDGAGGGDGPGPSESWRVVKAPELIAALRAAAGLPPAA